MMEVTLKFNFKSKPKRSGSYLVLINNGKTYHFSDVDYSAKWERWNASDFVPPMYAFNDADVVAWAEITDAERMVNYEYTKQFVSKNSANHQ